jgi:outer membrane protein OmpA-like peptidoglycan-associated protein
MKSIKFLFVITLSLFVLASCGKWSRTAKGGAIGTAGGAAAGAAIGAATGNTAAGAIFGAAIGGVAGATIGAYMDKQAEELEEELEDAEIERVGEGIQVTFGSGILFDVNSANLKAEATENINKMAETLKKYEDTEVLIEGHTDDTGADDYNQDLSEERAASVADYLKSLGVKSRRLEKVGYGEMQPVEDNTTEVGRTANRRVEIAIFANDKLKKQAEQGELEVEE